MNVNILAFDTSNEFTSVAIYSNGNIFFDLCKSNKNHNEIILPMIRRCLSHSKLSLPNINLLAFSRGPGSFIGSRISSGIVQGLSLSLKIPVVGFSSLFSLAYGFYNKSKQKRILAMLYVNKKNTYYAFYNFIRNNYLKMKNIGKLVSFKHISNIIDTIDYSKWLFVTTNDFVFENLSCKNFNFFKKEIYIQSARDLILLALSAWKKKKFSYDFKRMMPLYF